MSLMSFTDVWVCRKTLAITQVWPEWSYCLWKSSLVHMTYTVICTVSGRNWSYYLISSRTWWMNVKVVLELDSFLVHHWWRKWYAAGHCSVDVYPCVTVFAINWEFAALTHEIVVYTEYCDKNNHSNTVLTWVESTGSCATFKHWGGILYCKVLWCILPYT